MSGGVYVGVDLGVNGVIVMRDTAIPRTSSGAWTIRDIPVTPIPKSGGGYKSVYLLKDIYDIFEPHKRRIRGVMLEDVHAIPPPNPNIPGARVRIAASAQSNFSLGYGLCAVEAPLSILQIPYYKVAPQTWKKHMLAGVADKADKESILNVGRMEFPELAQYLRFKKDHNTVEAAFLCEYGIRHQWPSFDGWVEPEEEMEILLPPVESSEVEQKPLLSMQELLKGYNFDT